MDSERPQPKNLFKLAEGRNTFGAGQQALQAGRRIWPKASGFGVEGLKRTVLKEFSLSDLYIYAYIHMYMSGAFTEPLPSRKKICTKRERERDIERERASERAREGARWRAHSGLPPPTRILESRKEETLDPKRAT